MGFYRWSECPLSVSVLTVMATASCVGFSETDHENLRLSVSPRKRAIFPGEPCLLDVLLVSEAISDREIDLGWDGYGAFWFEIFDAAGKRIRSSSPMVMKGGISRLSRALVRAGEEVRRKVVLNQWCQTLLVPGEYDVICHLKASGFTMQARCQIVIQEENENELSKLFSDLAATILGRTPIEKRYFASRMLASTRSPHAVTALAQVVRVSRPPQIRREAMMALAKIRTVEAVQELCAIALNEGEKSANVRRTAIALVHEVSEVANDPAVREACRSVTSTTTRQRTPTTRD